MKPTRSGRRSGRRAWGRSRNPLGRSHRACLCREGGAGTRRERDVRVSCDGREIALRTRAALHAVGATSGPGVSFSPVPGCGGRPQPSGTECPRCFGGGPRWPGRVFCSREPSGRLPSPPPGLEAPWCQVPHRAPATSAPTGRCSREPLRNRLRDGGCHQERGAETSCKPACSAAGVFWLWQRLPARHLPRAQLFSLFAQ